MKYINKTGKDVQMNLPRTSPVEWVVVKEGESKEINVTESYAARFGLYTEEEHKALEEEKTKEEEVVPEESSIGEVKVETKKVKETKKKTSKKKSKK